MATLDTSNILGSSNAAQQLGIPKTRKGVEQLLIKTLRKNYGLEGREDVSYGTIRKKYRKYYSEHGGHIDIRTLNQKGGPTKWEENGSYDKNLKKEIKEARSALLTAKSSTRFGPTRQVLSASLNRINRFSNAQEARDAVTDHIMAKSQNWWSIRNLASPLDHTTGKRLYEKQWEKDLAIKEKRVKELEGKTTDTSYKVPKNILKIIQPQGVDVPGQPVDEGYWDGDKWVSTLSPENQQKGTDLNTGVGVTQQPVKENEAKGQTEVNNDVVDKTQINQTNKEKVGNDAAVTGSLERWQRGQGRTRKQATNQSLQWLKDQGFDTSKINKFNQADLMEDLRIRGPNYTKNDKSMLRIGSGPDSILLKKIKNNNLKINKNNNQQIATPILNTGVV